MTLKDLIIGIAKGDTPPDYIIYYGEAFKYHDFEDVSDYVSLNDFRNVKNEMAIFDKQMLNKKIIAINKIRDISKINEEKYYYQELLKENEEKFEKASFGEKGYSYACQLKNEYRERIKIYEDMLKYYKEDIDN